MNVHKELLDELNLPTSPDDVDEANRVTETMKKKTITELRSLSPEEAEKALEWFRAVGYVSFPT